MELFASAKRKDIIPLNKVKAAKGSLDARREVSFPTKLKAAKRLLKLKAVSHVNKTQNALRMEYAIWMASVFLH